MQPDIDLHDDLQVPFQPAVANEFTPMTAYLLTGKIWLFITWGYLYEQELQFSTRDSHYPQLAKETVTTPSWPRRHGEVAEQKMKLDVNATHKECVVSMATTVNG